MEDRKFKIAILGPENSGKSSIMNALFGRYVSLVSEVGGTTKMPIKKYWGKLKIGRSKENPEFINIVFVDLGGLYTTSDKQSPIMTPKILEKTFNEINDADMIIHVIDGSIGLLRSFEKLHHLLKFRYQKPIIVVINKCDLLNNIDKEILKKYVENRLKNTPIFVSAKTFEGIPELLDTIIRYLKR
ncbi:GTP-binding protein Era [Methanocaldococcus lauensis]|nr:GTP-binding protein Era [Methanocaldococcus lauensis]